MTKSRLDERLAILEQDPAKPYFIRYQVKCGRFDESDATENDGLTQDLILISCITQADGSYSQDWRAINGAKAQTLHSRDVLKAWILMAASLREHEDLHPGEREFLNAVFESWRRAQLATA